MSGLPKSTLKVLVQGQEQDIVPRLVPPGAALVLENLIPDHQGNWVKRNGYNALTEGSIPAGVTAPRAWALGTHRGTLLRFGRQGQQPIEIRPSQNSAKWVAPTVGVATESRGPMIATVQKLGPVATAGNSYDHHDIAIAAGTYQVITFQEQGQSAPGQVHEMLADLTTGQIIMDRLAGGAGHQMFPHVVTLSAGYACYVYNNDGTLTADIFNAAAADPTASAGSIVLSSEPVADTPIEVVAHQNGTDIIVGYMGQSGQFRAATLRPSIGAVVSVVNLKTQAGTAILVSNAFAWVQNLHGVTWSNGYPALVVRDASTGLTEHIGWTVSGADFVAGRTTVVDAGEHTLVNVAAATASTGSGTSIAVDVIWHTNGGSVPAIKHAPISTTGSVAISTDYMNLLLASKLFADAAGRVCFLAVTPWTDQATLYVVTIRVASDTFPSPLCRTEVRAAFPATTASHIPTPATPDASTVYLTAGVQVPMGVATSGPPLPVSGENVDVVKLQFRNGVEPILPAPNLGNPVEAIESTFVPGGQLTQWDGKSYGAAGFAYAPQSPTLAASLTAGSLTPNVDYHYVAVYAHTDAQGRRWRSAPSAFSTQNTGVDTSIAVLANYLQLVSAPGVEVELYRDTPNTPYLFQKLPGIYANVANDPANPNLSVTDTYGDDVVAAGEFLYTTGNILPADITPGFTCLVVFDGRLWGVSADDPQAMWFSDPLTPPGVPAFATGAGLFFNESLIVDVRDDRGPITGLGVCDGRMVVFKHDAIYTIEGNGPDNTGAGSTYVVQRIAGSVGCDNPRSIIDAFDGVWFLSSSDRAGFWRLDRGTALQYVGGGVRDLIALPVVGGVSLPEQSQIRWYTQDATAGRILVYDVVTQAWTTFTGPTGRTSADCAIAWNGLGVFSSQTAGNILIEASGVYTDAGDAFGQRVVLPWLQMADLQGFQRVYTYQGIGATIADHRLKVNLYRDLLDTDEPFSGGDYAMALSTQPRWDWEIRFPMKLSAVKVEIISEPTIVDGFATPTAGFAFSGIAVEYGQKVGLKPTVYTHRLTHS